MEFGEVIKQRHCTRSFNLERQVSDEMIAKIITAAKMAPSAGNMQDWRFTIIREAEIKQKIVEATSFGKQKFIAEAPVIIVVSSDLTVADENYGERGVSLYSIQDVAAACENLFLACINEGLSTCWVGAFDETKLKSSLNLPDNWRPMVALPIGYKISKVSN